MEYYSSKYNMRTVELILFTPYGEMDHEEKLIPYLIKQALQKNPVNLSSGFQKLNMVYVEDVAAAFVKALDLVERNSFTHHRIDVASARSYSIRDIVTVIEDVIQSNLIVKWNSVKINETDQDDEIIIDTSASEKVLKWKPKFDIYEGLAKTIDYYKGEVFGN
jgi:nucleoside-diphosphate-sugar epimerase